MRKRNSMQKTVTQMICYALTGCILLASAGCSENTTVETEVGTHTDTSVNEEAAVDIWDVINGNIEPQTYLQTQNYKETNTANYYSSGTNAITLNDDGTIKSFSMYKDGSLFAGIILKDTTTTEADQLLHNIQMEQSNWGEVKEDELLYISTNVDEYTPTVTLSIKDSVINSLSFSYVNQEKAIDLTAKYPEITEPATQSTDTIEFTVEAAYVVQELGQTKPLDGAVYMVIEYHYKNISNQPISGTPTIKLINSDQVEYTGDANASFAASFTDRENTEKIISDLNPGLTVKGYEVFEVAKNELREKEWNIMYKDQGFLDSLFGDPGDILYFPFNDGPDFTYGFDANSFYEDGQTAAELQGTSTKAVQTASEYILPDSNIRLLTEEEINSLSQDELRIAVNEIYARHGRKFADATLQEYFNTKSWYQGTIEPDQFSEMIFNEFEKENVKKLSDRKNEKPSERLAVEQIYGIYECHTEYITAELEVGVYTDDGTDYIHLTGSNSDGSGYGEFDGIVVSVKESNYTAVDEFGNVIDVSFDGSGNAKVTDGNTGLGGMNFPGFEGIYQMTEDFSHVG